MTASRHRRLARTGGHPRRRAPVSKCAPCYKSPAPRVITRIMPRVACHGAYHSGVRSMSISSRSSPGASRSAPGQRPVTVQPGLAWKCSSPVPPRTARRSCSRPISDRATCLACTIRVLPITLAACGRKALEMADGAPISDERARIALDVHPAGQGIAGPRDEEPAAFRAEASEQLVSDRCDVGDSDRKTWEPDRPAGVANQDPAVDKFPSQAGGDLLRAGYLAHQRINALARPRSLPGRCVKLQTPPASAAPSARAWLEAPMTVVLISGRPRDPGRSSLRWWIVEPLSRRLRDGLARGPSSRSAATACATCVAEARSSLISVMNQAAYSSVTLIAHAKRTRPSFELSAAAPVR
jgi:hypothetical protein